MRENERWPAVFLDRDGTINEEVGYLDRIEKLRLIPGAAEAIRLLNKSGMKAIVITNQSGVARGFYDEAFVEKTHAHLREVLRAEGAFLDGLYFCPHHPTEGRGEYLRVCGCRKPAPGLLLRAAKELRLDLARSYMVGDTLKDVETGARAGVRGILVRTGYGEEENLKLEGKSVSREPGGIRPAALEESVRQADPRQPDHVAADILEAVQWILRNRRP